MSTENAVINVEVSLKLEKFDGDYFEGAVPVDIIEKTYIFNSAELAIDFISDFIKEGQNGND